MEIEPEVIPPEDRSRRPRPFVNRPPWQAALAGITGLALLLLMAWLAFWLVVVLIGLAVIGWLVRKVITLITGRPPRGSSNFQVTIQRGPPRRE